MGALKSTKGNQATVGENLTEGQQELTKTSPEWARYRLPRNCASKSWSASLWRRAASSSAVAAISAWNCRRSSFSCQATLAETTESRWTEVVCSLRGVVRDQGSTGSEPARFMPPALTVWQKPISDILRKPWPGATGVEARVLTVGELSTMPVMGREPARADRCRAMGVEGAETEPERPLAASGEAGGEGRGETTALAGLVVLGRVSRMVPEEVQALAEGDGRLDGRERLPAGERPWLLRGRAVLSSTVLRLLVCSKVLRALMSERRSELALARLVPLPLVRV